jgi:gliding motility-associated-like protein/CSLREA domain-containing protein
MRIQFLAWLLIGGVVTGYAQTITVNVLDDQNDGSCTVEHCSLREAVIRLNEGEATSINFDQSLTDTLWLEEPLPTLRTGDLVIQGAADQGVVLSTQSKVGYGWQISASRVTLKGFNFSGFEEFGLKLDSFAEFVFLSNNHFNYNGEAGLYVENANHVSIGQMGQPNWMIGNQTGLYFAYKNTASLITVVGNTIEGNGIGILGKGLTRGSYLGHNIIKKDSLTGIVLTQSEGTRIFYNEIIGPTQQGILVEQSNNITIQENLLATHTIGILQKGVGKGNQYTQNQFDCTIQPIVIEQADQVPPKPDQICYDGYITGFSQPFSRIEAYGLTKDSCNEKDGMSWTFLGEIQSEQSGRWQYEEVDSAVQQVAALAIDAHGSTSEFSIPVGLTAYPAANLQVDSGICWGDSTTLSAELNASIDEEVDFYWSSSNGFEQQGLKIQEVLESGWFSFRATKDFCSKELDSIFVHQKDLDTIKIGPSYGSLCYDTEIEIAGLSINSANARQTIIKEGRGEACDTVVEIDLDFLEPPISFLNPSICRSDTFKWGSRLYYEGKERDTILLPNAAQSGCDSMIILEVDFIDHPVKRLNGDLCIDDFEIINGVQYDINHSSGQYWISGEDGNCDTLVEISFNFHSPQNDTIIGTYCEGSQFIVNGVVYDINHPKGVEYMTNKYGCDSVIYVDLTFDFNTIHYLDTILCDNETLVINGQLYDRNRTSGVEQFIAGGNVNCDSIVYVEITYTERQGEVTLSPLWTIEQGASIVIDPLINFNPATIIWTSNLNMSCTECRSPTVLGDQSGWLKLTVTDANGCSYETVTQLEIQGIRNNFAFIPNAFSPNGDGINDVFAVFPDYNWVAEVGRLKIVDRWGRLVYSSYIPKWDGTVDGRAGLPGVYLFTIELIMKDGKVRNQNGSVFLYR